MDYCLISLWRKKACISIFFSDEGQSENRPKCLEGGGGGGAHMTATVGRVVSLRSLNLFILFFSFYFVRLFVNLFEDSKRTTFRCLYKTISSFIYIQCIATKLIKYRVELPDRVRLLNEVNKFQSDTLLKTLQ